MINIASVEWDIFVDFDSFIFHNGVSRNFYGEITNIIMVDVGFVSGFDSNSICDLRIGDLI